MELRHRFPADRSLHSILNIGHINTVAIGLASIDHQIYIGLPDHAEDAEIRDSRNLTHHGHDLVAGRFHIVPGGNQGSGVGVQYGAALTALLDA